MQILVDVFAVIGAITVLLVVGATLLVVAYLAMPKESGQARHEREEAERCERKRQRALWYRDMFAGFRPTSSPSDAV
jgi:hypothetical protein